MATGTLIYDSDCGFCTQCVVWGREHVGEQGVAVVASRVADLAGWGIPAERAQHEVLFRRADGAVAGGALAIAAWLEQGPFWARIAGAVLQAPLVRTLAAAVYRVVARNRHRLPGGTASCAL